MTFKTSTVALALAASVAAPSSAFAFGLGFGCSDLPELYRARGALQGMTSACDMSVEEAQRIVAEHDNPGAAQQPRGQDRRYRGPPPRQ